VRAFVGRKISGVWDRRKPEHQGWTEESFRHRRLDILWIMRMRFAVLTIAYWI
jgi:hypothetical protein